MSNLLNDTEGRNVVLVAQRDLLRRRISRFFKRNLVVDYEQWSNGGEFDLATLLGSLNVAWDDELRDLYRLLGHIGGLNESVQNETIYVSPTGNDITGTGSATSPYATLWFLPFLPRVIAHDYQILIQGNVNYGGIMTVEHSFSDQGCLSFIGVGVSVDPYAGVLDGVSTAQDNPYSTQRVLTLSVAPQTSGNRYFVRMKDGGSQNHAAPITYVSTGSSVIMSRLNPLASTNIGDAYSYCIPPVTLTVEGMNVTALNGDNTANHDFGLDTPDISRINFVNLNIDYQPSVATKRSFVTSGAPMGFWFCRILSTENSPGEDIVFKNDINRFNPVTLYSVLEASSQSDITNIFLSVSGLADSAGLSIVNRDSNVFLWDDIVIRLEDNARLNCVDCMATWRVSAANVILWQCSAASYSVYESTARLINCFANPNAHTGSENAVEAWLSTVWYDHGVIGTCEYAFYLKSSFLRMEAFGYLGTAQYASLVSGLSKIFMQAIWGGLPAAVADISFPDPTVPLTVAFPAASAVQTDALENSVMRPA